mmetsp:Transcript_28402/g.55865  ORF Transcript_28402/g.55865 Transcript_28402/m.55865 type:complete len:86 (+) Transcript_28402:514-771(+)
MSKLLVDPQPAKFHASSHPVAHCRESAMCVKKTIALCVKSECVWFRKEGNYVSSTQLTHWNTFSKLRSTQVYAEGVRSLIEANRT